MEHKIINTGDYLLIVDDSEIKVGDYCLMFDDYGNSFLGNTPQKYLGESAGHFLNKGLKKVISHLPLNNSPILEGVDLLPPLEDEVEKLAKKQLQSIEKVVFITSTKEEEYLFCDGFEIGYNKSKEKYKYTEEDLRKAFRSGAFTGAYTGNNSGIHIEKEENIFIQSTQQPKMPVGFKCEMVQKKPKHTDYGVLISFDNEPFTVVNTQGLTQWVGEYIY